MLRGIAPYTTRAKVLSTPFLLLYLAPLNQQISAEARKHEIVGKDASFILEIFDTAKIF